MRHAYTASCSVFCILIDPKITWCAVKCDVIFHSKISEYIVIGLRFQFESTSDGQYALDLLRVEGARLRRYIFHHPATKVVSRSESCIIYIRWSVVPMEM